MEIQKTRLSDGRDAVLFWNADEPNGVFSNWHDEPFVVDDFCYRHVEQYMMAQKAKLFHDAAHYTAILKCDDPGECKKMGKQVTPFNSFLWDAHKYAIVYTANRAKYEQNPALKEALLATGDLLLAEASPYDKIWGIGLGRGKAALTDPADWEGENLLGKILMQLRKECQWANKD